MRGAVLAAVVSLCAVGTGADLLPSQRRVNWRNAGYPGAIPAFEVGVNVVQWGAAGDGKRNDTEAIRQAIEAAPAHSAVLFPPGTYRVTGTLRLRSGLVLRGSGATITTLRFDLEGAGGNCIEAVSSALGENVPCLGGVNKGSWAVQVADASQFSPGDVVEIQQENDPRLMYTDPLWEERWDRDWAMGGFVGAVGQFARVTAIVDECLFLDRPLAIDFRPDLFPVARRVGMVEEVGVEDIRIERTDTSPAYMNHLILFKRVASGWVQRVEGAYSPRHHVSVESCLNIEVRDSYFHHAHSYTGGCGYGVALMRHTTGCLVENCIFEHLRHAYLLQAGANSNVLAYCYLTDAYGINADSKPFLPADVSLHGYYPFMNLFEGNMVENIVVSDWWGPAGPGNTFLRNFIALEDLKVRDHSHSQNILGNDLLGSDRRIAVDRSVRDTLVAGNRAGGGSAGEQRSEQVPFSYYLQGKPAFFRLLPWPPFGPQTPFGEGTIPARERFREGRMIPDRRPAPLPPLRLHLRY